LNFYTLLLYGLLEIIVIVGLTTKSNRLARTAHHLIKFKAEMNIDTNALKLLKNNLLNIGILECIRIVDKSILIG
jgi:hypothetical protein